MVVVVVEDDDRNSCLDSEDGNGKVDPSFHETPRSRLTTEAAPRELVEIASVQTVDCP